MTTRSLRRLFALFLLVNLLFLIWGLAHRHPTDLTVTFLDVGQGDACVIEVTVSAIISIRRMALQLIDSE